MKRNMTKPLAFAILLAAQACTSSELVEEAAQAEPVRTLMLDYTTISRTIDYTANLEAYNEIHLAPAAPGRIISLPFQTGDRVKKGDLLVKMDETQLVQAEVQLRTLETDFRRLDTLLKAGSIPKQQYDQLLAQLDIAKANVAFLRDNTSLFAPFNGIVSGRYFEPGEIYSGAPNPMIGKSAIVSLVQIEKLKASVAVAERYLPQLGMGTTVELAVDAYTGTEFNARVLRIHPTIDPASRSFVVELVIDNSSGLLRPGMFARASFGLEEVNAILLPSQAVLKLQGANDRYLFVNDNGVARRVAVTVGQRHDDMVEVFSDKLKKGSEVVVSGQARLIDGVPIQAIN
jgi:membrane fusion protein, multidrug efflux system